MTLRITALSAAAPVAQAGSTSRLRSVALMGLNLLTALMVVALCLSSFAFEYMVFGSAAFWSAGAQVIFPELLLGVVSLAFAGAGLVRLTLHRKGPLDFNHPAVMWSVFSLMAMVTQIVTAQILRSFTCI